MLSLRGITKRFGRTEALNNVTVDFRGGEIHAILGENGAGKSTLVNVIYGLVRPDRGSLFLDGRRTEFHGPIDARRAGIGMVHQEFALVDALSVAENLAVALSPPRTWILRRDCIHAGAARLAREVGLDIGSLTAPVRTLPVGMRQRIEIVKALAGDTRILILDEPTAVLTPAEITTFFGVLDQLRSSGRTVLFITHKLQEVMDVADRVTVMRRGRLVQTIERHATTKAELAELMIGRLAPPAARPPRPRGHVAAPALCITGLSVTDERGVAVLSDVAMRLDVAEILAVAGVDGNGQSELFQVLAGLRRPERGTIEIAGTPPARHDPPSMIAAGVACVPPDRQRYGIVREMSVQDNAILNITLLHRLSRGPFLPAAPRREAARALVDRYAVRTSALDAPAAHLSGGNVQRLIVARALETHPRVLVAFNPTRGLDVAASQALYDALHTAAARGTAVLLISTDLDEILDLADRVTVLCRGRLSETFGRPFPVDRVGWLMAGGT